MDVREAVRSGTTTIIIGTGGVEQNGPYVAGGKHNFVLQTVLAAHRPEIGNALIAPIVKFVHEASSSRRRPGTCRTPVRSASSPRRSRRCSPTTCRSCRRTRLPTSSARRQRREPGRHGAVATASIGYPGGAGRRESIFLREFSRRGSCGATTSSRAWASRRSTRHHHAGEAARPPERTGGTACHDDAASIEAQAAVVVILEPDRGLTSG